jgi:hypothetical protein
MRRTKADEAATIDRQHLTRVLLEQIERTYDTEGRGGVIRIMEELLGHLDDPALREYAYAKGLTSEHDLEPQDEGGRAPQAEPGG